MAKGGEKVSSLISGFIGILLGLVLIVSIQIACNKFCSEEDYPKMVVIALASTFSGILMVILLINITK